MVSDSDFKGTSTDSTPMVRPSLSYSGWQNDVITSFTMMPSVFVSEKGSIQYFLFS